MLKLVFTEWKQPGDLPKNVKIFEGTVFRYQRIAVDRPLRMRVRISKSAVKAFKGSKAWQALGTVNATKDAARKLVQAQAKQAKMLDVFKAVAKAHPVDANAFLAALRAAVATTKAAVAGKEYKLSLTATLVKAVMEHLFEKDPAAAPLLDKDGNQIADPALRDYENVPDGGEIEDYMAKEVLPHVPDAWRAGDPVTGYEIPFTRYFYEYKPPRPLDEIRGDIESLDEDITRLTKEVLS